MTTQNDNENLIYENTFNKIKNVAEKAGYRDGITEGRESNFQNSFDEGFKEGMTTGLTLGIYKSILSFDTENDNLQKTSRGNCIICKNNINIDDKTIIELTSLQLQDNKKILEELYKKHPNELNQIEEICLKNCIHTN